VKQFCGDFLTLGTIWSNRFGSCFCAAAPVLAPAPRKAPSLRHIPWFGYNSTLNHQNLGGIIMAEERTRIHTRIIPETEHKIAAAMPPSNCQTQNEFVKKALRFYCDYTFPQSCFSVLPPMLVAAIRANERHPASHWRSAECVDGHAVLLNSIGRACDPVICSSRNMACGLRSISRAGVQFSLVLMDSFSHGDIALCSQPQRAAKPK